MNYARDLIRKSIFEIIYVTGIRHKFISYLDIFAYSKARTESCTFICAQVVQTDIKLFRCWQAGKNQTERCSTVPVKEVDNN